MANINSSLKTVREDDFVEYYLFPKIEKDCIPKSNDLQKVLTDVKSTFAKYSYSSYIWQKDELNLVLKDKAFPSVDLDESAEKLPAHLYGVTHYGDNIEDEWFIVFLILKATLEIPGLAARIVDVDGEFILIEAAEYLPKWATPETCAQRVFLYEGAVHLVKHEGSLEVSEAIEIIRSDPAQTKASPGVQEAIFNRIKGYPECIAENLHSCNVYVPVGVAALLKARPCLVAPAVTAFCHRDPLDLKACRAMRYFPPEHCVMTRVVFTKCLYAMLTHQKYTPDRRTGWKLPPSNDPSYNAKLLGVKLACGFEILVTQRKISGQTEELSKDWQRYKQALIDRGYFKNLLEGSQEYTRLEEEAKEFFRTQSVECQPCTGQLILDLLSGLEIDTDDMHRNEENLPPPDDDSWLDVTPAQLDQLLEQKYGSRPSRPTSDVSARLADFLNHVSSVDGAEFPQDNMAFETPPVRPKRGIKSRKPAGTVEKENDDDNRVSFDHEAFSCAVQNILDFVVPEDNWDMESDGSGMSSYEDEVDIDLDNKTGEQSDTPISELKQYMDQMDRELSTTAVGKSFEKAQSSTNKKAMEDSFSEVENFEPVDIDMNALKNILASYQAQMGGAGPASNLLGPMGVKLDDQ